MNDEFQELRIEEAFKLNSEDQSSAFAQNSQYGGINTMKSRNLFEQLVQIKETSSTYILKVLSFIVNLALYEDPKHKISQYLADNKEVRKE